MAPRHSKAMKEPKEEPKAPKRIGKKTAPPASEDAVVEPPAKVPKHDSGEHDHRHKTSAMLGFFKYNSKPGSEHAMECSAALEACSFSQNGAYCCCCIPFVGVAYYVLHS